MLPPLTDGIILRNRYVITDVVGQGGMGSVYRAEDMRLPGRLCAIKEVQADPQASPDMIKQAQTQFLQEASILAQLDHPNLPKVSDFFTDAGRDYLVMDYVPGQDLKQILHENLADGHPVPERLVYNWAMQILDALDYLHHQDPPVLHRDIKPANIKLTPDNRIKLVDFGLAKLLAGDDAKTITVIQGRGTELYTPLEQYGGQFDHTDGRSDIYALGATLYTLTVGRPPPSARERFLNPTALQAPHTANKDVSPVMSDAILWALAMHPDSRPDSNQALREALQGRKRPFDGRLQPSEPEWMVALRHNRTALFITAVLFAAAVLLTIL